MTWTSIYLVCFLLGFSLSAISWLLGALHLHLPHGLHDGLHAHGHGHGGHGGHGAHSAHLASAPSPYNFATVTAFLAWFGGAGYLLTRYAELWPPLGLLLAIAVGAVGDLEHLQCFAICAFCWHFFWFWPALSLQQLSAPFPHLLLS
jgi:hypothetical protein